MSTTNKHKQWETLTTKDIKKELSILRTLTKKSSDITTLVLTVIGLFLGLSSLIAVVLAVVSYYQLDNIHKHTKSLYASSIN